MWSPAASYTGDPYSNTSEQHYSGIPGLADTHGCSLLREVEEVAIKDSGVFGKEMPSNHVQLGSMISNAYTQQVGPGIATYCACFIMILVIDPFEVEARWRDPAPSAPRLGTHPPKPLRTVDIPTEPAGHAHHRDWRGNFHLGYWSLAAWTEPLSGNSGIVKERPQASGACRRPSSAGA